METEKFQTGQLTLNPDEMASVRPPELNNEAAGSHTQSDVEAETCRNEGGSSASIGTVEGNSAEIESSGERNVVMDATRISKAELTTVGSTAGSVATEPNASVPVSATTNTGEKTGLELAIADTDTDSRAAETVHADISVGHSVGVIETLGSSDAVGLTQTWGSGAQQWEQSVTGIVFCTHCMHGHLFLVLTSLITYVGPVSAVGKHVGPVIKMSLVRNSDWTVTIFYAPLPSTGSLVSV
jgi:hypothetical protein